MSNCEKCGKTSCEEGYTTGCEHYPPDDGALDTSELSPHVKVISHEHKEYTDSFGIKIDFDDGFRRNDED